jgi:arabinose-5-phosphate isomerase
VLISNRGTSLELQSLVPLLRQFRSPLIGVLGNSASPLAPQMDVLLDASVEREADPHNLAPTASAVTALALGHGLAIALMCARNFTPEEFGRFHPGGQLGRNLRLSVAEAMHTGDEVAWVAPDTLLKDVIIAMTRRPLGGACVVAAGGTLAGFLTDGDLRRALTSHDDIRTLRAADAMTPAPVTVGPEANLGLCPWWMGRGALWASCGFTISTSERDSGRPTGRRNPKVNCILLELHNSYTTLKSPLLA